MYYLSFDIGIKNLSYIFCNYDDSGLEVIDWNIISIFSQQPCLKSGCTDLITTYITPNKTCVCKKHLPEVSKQHYKKDLISPEKDINFLVDCLFSSLDQLLTKLGKSDIHIIIEQQPSKNNVMKLISIMVFSYFKLNPAIASVNFINSKNKLKIDKINFYQSIPDFKETIEYSEAKLKDYKYRKKLSVKIVSELLGKDIIKDKENVFSGSKKKDDLSDCLLQLIYHLK